MKPKRKKPFGLMRGDAFRFIRGRAKATNAKMINTHDLSRHPGPHEITCKEWRLGLAAKLGIAHNTVYRLMERGEIARPKMRIVNQRVKFVILDETF